eukprot:965412-Prymnesium_polylepis.1
MAAPDRERGVLGAHGTGRHQLEARRGRHATPRGRIPGCRMSCCEPASCRPASPPASPLTAWQRADPRWPTPPGLGSPLWACGSGTWRTRGPPRPEWRT